MQSNGRTTIALKRNTSLERLLTGAAHNEYSDTITGPAAAQGFETISTKVEELVRLFGIGPDQEYPGFEKYECYSPIERSDPHGEETRTVGHCSFGAMRGRVRFTEGKFDACYMSHDQILNEEQGTVWFTKLIQVDQEIKRAEISSLTAEVRRNLDDTKTKLSGFDCRISSVVNERYLHIDNAPLLEATQIKSPILMVRVSTLQGLGGFLFE